MSEAGRDSSPAERDFQALADNIPTLCWMANADGWITWYNRRWYAFTGTTPAEMEGWGWQSVHDPDRLQDVLARWQASIATGRAFDMTFPLRAADGRYRPFLTRAEPVRDEAGRVRRWFGVNIDISEQADAEAALRAERDRSLGIIETMREGFLLLDRDFVIRQINAEGLRMEGRPASEIVGRSHWDVYPGTEHHEIGRLYKQAFREGVPIGLDHRYVWPDGHAAWIEMRAYPAPDRGSLAIFYREVTAAKEAEAALRASEAQFRAFAQAMPNHVWAGRADGQLYWFNAGVYAYSGAAPGTLDGIAWTDIVHPDDLPAAAEAWGAALAAGTVYETEFRIRRADGAYRWFLIRAEPIRGEDGAVTGWIGTNTDIHDQKLAQGKLSLFNETLAREVALRTAERDRMWRLSTDLLLVAAFDTSVTAINPAWTRVLGWTEDEVVGQPFIGLVHPDWRAATLAEMGRLSEGATTFNFENRARHRDGSYRTFAWTAVPGEGFIHAVGRDITPEREAADALARAEEQLRQAQKMEAVGQLTGGIAHDFNNLLTGIVGALAILQRRVDAGRTEGLERYTGAAITSAQRAAALTQRLLAFARRQPLDPKPVEANRLVAGMEDLLRRTLGPSIDLEVVLAGGLWPALCDPNQLESALLNLAINARDAMPEGGRLTVETANAHLDEAYARAQGGEVKPGQYVAICVTDTGAGMAPEVAARAFEPFFTT
ncbi:MAG TPA: PAS domain S-box protein, partial [Geminicoccaceae bacterium]